MVHIYTFCDKSLIGKMENKSATCLCENLYKLNFIIDECCILPTNYNFENLAFKNKDMYFLLLQKTSSKLNAHIAGLLNEDLQVNEMLKKIVNDNYTRKNIPLDKDANDEWLIAKSAVPITNPNGKTQGYLIKIADATVFVLPNNYSEFLSIYNDCLLSYLEQNFQIETSCETFKTFGLSEEFIQQILKDQIKNKDKVRVSIFSKGLENDIVIKSKLGNEKFATIRQAIFDKLEKYIYAVQAIPMSKHLENQICTNNIKLAVVGDMSISDICNEFDVQTIVNNICGVSILPNQNAKISFGITEAQISEHGENSPETAYNLAVLTLNKHPSCDIVLSCICSITNNKCTAFIAIGNNQKIDIYKNQFYGTQNEILTNINQTAKFYLIKKIKARDYKTL